MTQVTISEAARRVGIARSTLLRHIKNGKVSKVIGKDGKPWLDTSELLRVYGDLKNSDTILERHKFWDFHFGRNQKTI